MKMLLTIIFLVINSMSVIASTKVEIFTTFDMPVSNVSDDMDICYLDVFKSMKNEINNIASKYSNINQLSDWLNIKSEDINNKANCINQAYEYQIEKLPAIVIDKKYVTYGMRNVSNALREYYYMENSHA